MTESYSAFMKPQKIKSLDELGGLVSTGLSDTNFTPQVTSALVNYNDPSKKSIAGLSNNMFLGSGISKTAENANSMNLLGGADAKKVLGDETPWYQDSGRMQGYAQLGGLAMQLYSLPQQERLAKLQEKGLNQNIEQANVDNAQRALVRSNLANHKAG